MRGLTLDWKVEIVEFVIDLQKGLIDDERWDFDVEQCDWEAYQNSFLDPTHLRTTLAVWLNHLRLGDDGNVANSVNARFRAAQYFRAYFDRGYSITPPLEQWEIVEPF